MSPPGTSHAAIFSIPFFPWPCAGERGQRCLCGYRNNTPQNVPFESSPVCAVTGLPARAPEDRSHVITDTASDGRKGDFGDQAEGDDDDPGCRFLVSPWQPGRRRYRPGQGWGGAIATERAPAMRILVSMGWPLEFGVYPLGEAQASNRRFSSIARRGIDFPHRLWSRWRGLGYRSLRTF